MPLGTARRPSRRLVTGAAPVAAAATIAVALAACSSPQPSVRSTQPPPTTSTSVSATSTTASGVAHCAAADLQGTVAGSQGAAGTIELTVALRNTTSAPCAIEGYPGALLYDANGSPLPTDVVRGGTFNFTDFAAAPVTVAAGSTAFFNVAYSDVPTNNATCPSAASLWVTPPDDTDHLTVTARIMACDGGKLTVSPVFAAGSPASQTTAPQS